LRAVVRASRSADQASLMLSFSFGNRRTSEQDCPRRIFLGESFFLT